MPKCVVKFNSCCYSDEVPPDSEMDPKCYVTSAMISASTVLSSGSSGMALGTTAIPDLSVDTVSPM